MAGKIFTWIDQDLCTGDGICQEICGEIYQGGDDGLYYVKEPEWPTIYSKDGVTASEEPINQMGQGIVEVPEHLLESAIEAGEECPGECIMFEVIE